jgi:hypothetical protein
MRDKARRHGGTGARRGWLVSLAPSHQHRRGFALVDVIIGGVMLGIGLAVIISLNSRSLANQVDGERQLTASWLADELLTTVLVEGPVEYPKLHDMSGQFEPPFSDFDYDVSIDELGSALPHHVTAEVRWNGSGGVRTVRVETYIARRNGDQAESEELSQEAELREPLEPVDREQRWIDLETRNEE